MAPVNDGNFRAGSILAGRCRRESIDHASAKATSRNECSKVSHADGAVPQSRYEGKEGQVFSHLSFDSDDRMDLLAQDGVSCSLCIRFKKTNWEPVKVLSADS
jgi:hypothetical protein